MLPAAATCSPRRSATRRTSAPTAATGRASPRLVRAGHTFVRVEDGEVVFKADVGSLALGCAQVQGVWLHPRLRGRGLSVPAMASVVEQVLSSMADEVSLYVNDFNAAARATYARCGFHEVGAFTTVLL